MTEIIARSRIGFWSAFLHEGRPVLNMRDPMTGEPITVLLTAGEANILGEGHVVAHLHARQVATRVDRRILPAVPTPPISMDEPVAYDWTTAPKAGVPVEART
jgi:hypothetical protein